MNSSYKYSYFYCDLFFFWILGLNFQHLLRFVLPRSFSVIDKHFSFVHILHIPVRRIFDCWKLRNTLPKEIVSNSVLKITEMRQKAVGLNLWARQILRKVVERSTFWTTLKQQKKQNNSSTNDKRFGKISCYSSRVETFRNSSSCISYPRSTEGCLK